MYYYLTLLLSYMVSAVLIILLGTLIEHGHDILLGARGRTLPNRQFRRERHRSSGSGQGRDALSFRQGVRRISRILHRLAPHLKYNPGPSIGVFNVWTAFFVRLPLHCNGGACGSASRMVVCFNRADLNEPKNQSYNVWANQVPH